MLGHDGPPTGLYRENLITGKPLAICPRRLWLDAPQALRTSIETYEEELYPAYEDGFLYTAGGVAQQPARYMDFMRAIGTLRKRTESRATEIIARRAREEGQDDSNGPGG